MSLSSFTKFYHWDTLLLASCIKLFINVGKVIELFGIYGYPQDYFQGNLPVCQFNHIVTVLSSVLTSIIIMAYLYINLHMHSQEIPLFDKH